MDEDQDQKRVFTRLGLSVKEINLHGSMHSMSRAWRVRHGLSPLLVRDANLLIRSHPDRRVGDAISDYVHEGSGRIAVDMAPDAGAAEADASAAQSIRAVADFLEQRERDRADGVITADEHRLELDAIKRAIRHLHRLHESVAAERVTERRPARALKIGGAR